MFFTSDGGGHFAKYWGGGGGGRQIFNMYAFGVHLRYANLSNIMLGISNSFLIYNCNMTITLSTTVCFKIRIQALKIRIQALKIRIQALKIRIRAFKIRI